MQCMEEIKNTGLNPDTTPFSFCLFNNVQLRFSKTFVITCKLILIKAIRFVKYEMITVLAIEVFKIIGWNIHEKSRLD